MKLNNNAIKPLLWVAGSALLLAACSNDDLEERFEDKIAAAHSESQTETENEAPSTNVVGTDAGAVVTIDGEAFDRIFADEFTGSTIDTSKWNTGFQWGSDLIINEEEQYYVNTQETPEFGYDPFQLDGELLTISAIETPANLSTAANGQPYLSGALTSNAKFTATYGYIEMRAKMPSGNGLWSNFWMLAAEFVDLKPQLFIVEHDGGKPNSLFYNYNYHDADGNLRSPGQWEVSGDNVTSEFHTYGVRWEEQSLVFYLDGVATYRIEGENVSSQPMYLLVNLAVGGLWPGSPQSDTGFPAELQIDYIRAYAKR